MKIKMLPLLISMIISGCGSTPTYEPVQRAQEPFHPPLADPIQSDPIKFIVITQKTAPKVLSVDSVYVALTWEDYLALGRNTDRTTNFIKAQMKTVCYYRKSLAEVACQDKK